MTSAAPPPAPEGIPVIDIARLLDRTADPAAMREARQEAADAIGTAARAIGFFYVAGHGLAPPEIDGIFAAAKRLFALPQAQKEALSIEHSRHNRGYVRLDGETLDPAQGKDHKEAFNIGLELPPDDPELLAVADFRGPNQWPALPGWRALMLDFYRRLWGIGTDLHRAIALDLRLPEAFFDRMIDRPLATLRLLHYPPRPATAPARLGAGAHTDYGNLTLLATDGVPGLQVQRRDGTWLDAPHVPGALLCNIGDCLMQWTNDIYVSTPHRVVTPAHRHRYSLAFFLDPNPDAVVECLPSCRGTARPPRYAPTTGGAYLKSRLDATYAFRADAKA